MQALPGSGASLPKLAETNLSRSEVRVYPKLYSLLIYSIQGVSFGCNDAGNQDTGIKSEMQQQSDE
jgi:hypothetical protein